MTVRVSVCISHVEGSVSAKRERDREKEKEKGREYRYQELQLICCLPVSLVQNVLQVTSSSLVGLCI
jgi:hypothetical protein